MAPAGGRARVLWTMDMWKQLGTRPSDMHHSSVLVDGDLLYVCTCNGVDRDADASKHDLLTRNRRRPRPRISWCWRKGRAGCGLRRRADRTEAVARAVGLSLPGRSIREN